MSDYLVITDDPTEGAAQPVPGISVTGFGRIAKADIRMSPLTILVGRNNTGKSYLASLIWAFRGLPEFFLGQSDPKLRAPAWFRDYVESAQNSRRRKPLEITGEALTAEINQWLGQAKSSIIKRVLSYEGASIEGFQIQLHGNLWLFPRKTVPEHFARYNEGGDKSYSSWMFSWYKKPSGDESFYGSTFYTGNFMNARDQRDFVDELYKYAVQKFISRNIGAVHGNAAYIPAARTGLMLALTSLYVSLIDSLGIDESQTNRDKFALPTIRFLQRITRGSNSNYTPFGDIAGFLEENILKGKVSRTEAKSTSFTYTPQGSEVALPLHITSSMVSELAPLLEVLKQGNIRNGLIFEEPEAHLHLSAQRWMARAIAKLVNRGVPVVLTTHSDTFLQQINLLIQLSAHKDRERLTKKYNYDNDELLSYADVAAYEFKRTEGGTVVEEADGGAEGLVIKSLNEALFTITEEALEISEDQ